MACGDYFSRESAFFFFFTAQWCDVFSEQRALKDSQVWVRAQPSHSQGGCRARPGHSGSYSWVRWAAESWAWSRCCWCSGRLAWSTCPWWGESSPGNTRENEIMSTRTVSTWWQILLMSVKNHYRYERSPPVKLSLFVNVYRQNANISDILIYIIKLHKTHNTKEKKGQVTWLSAWSVCSQGLS